MDLLKLPIGEFEKIYAATSNSKRIEILLRLYDSAEGMSFEELKKVMDLPSDTLNYHLKLLESKGLIENFLERHNRTLSQYRLTEKGKDWVSTMYKLMEKEV